MNFQFVVGNLKNVNIRKNLIYKKVLFNNEPLHAFNDPNTPHKVLFDGSSCIIYQGERIFFLSPEYKYQMNEKVANFFFFR